MLEKEKEKMQYANFAILSTEKICDYFGVKIAIYFAYLGHYTKSLTFPAFVGFLFWIMSSKNQVHLLNCLHRIFNSKDY